MHRFRARTRSAVALSLLGLPLAWPAGSASAADASGSVYEDRNRNGLRDPGEPGLPGVAVSNGREVVATDAAGRWRLAVADETVFFVTKPAGYAVPVDADMLPHFYYVHQPAGSPAELGLRYPGVAPTGPLPDSIDFALRPVDEPQRYSVILFSDPQPQTDAEVSFVRDDVVEDLVGAEAAFGITTGDIMFDDLSLFGRYNRIVGALGIPWYNVPGNHELNYLSLDDRYSLETFKRLFGPTYYSFDVGRVHHVVLDNVYYRGRDAGRREPTLRGAGRYEGRIDDDQLAWLENDLRFVDEDALVVLYMHIPLANPVRPDDPGVNVRNRKALFRLLRGRKVMAFAGHTHTTYHRYFGKEDGFDGRGELHHQVIATVSGSWWSGPYDERGVPVTLQRDGTPNGFHVMEVEEDRARVRYVPAGKPPGRQMRIVLDTTFHQTRPEATRDYRHGALLASPIRREQVASTEVLVNLFDGGPRSRVRLRIDDGEPVAMERVERPDPFAEELFQRHPDVKKPWVEATPCAHLWSARLPADLAAGVYVLTVEAENEYGDAHTGHKILEVVDAGS